MYEKRKEKKRKTRRKKTIYRKVFINHHQLKMNKEKTIRNEKRNSLKYTIQTKQKLN